MLTSAPEYDELLTWISKAVDYFDRAAESAPQKYDCAALYSEGKVVRMRLERERDER